MNCQCKTYPDSRPSVGRLPRIEGPGISGSTVPTRVMMDTATAVAVAAAHIQVTGGATGSLPVTRTVHGLRSGAE